MSTDGIIRIILLVDIAAMALLSIFYLRQRRLDWVSFFCWGLVALFVPVLGPFIVIANRPGEWDPSFSLAGEFRRVVSWVQRLLPSAPPDKKLGKLDRARMRKRKRLNNQFAQDASYKEEKLRKD